MCGTGNFGTEKGQPLMVEQEWWSRSRDQPPSLGRKAILPLRRMKVLDIDGGNIPGFCKRRQGWAKLSCRAL